MFVHYHAIRVIGSHCASADAFSINVVVALPCTFHLRRARRTLLVEGWEGARWLGSRKRLDEPTRGPRNLQQNSCSELPIKFVELRRQRTVLLSTPASFARRTEAVKRTYAKQRKLK